MNLFSIIVISVTFLFGGNVWAGAEITITKEKYQNIVKQNPVSDFEWSLESVKLRDLDYMTDRFGYIHSKRIAPNENRVFEYDFSKTKSSSDLSQLVGGFALGAEVGMLTTIIKLIDSIPRNCKFWFEVNNVDVIRKWKYSGKDCERIYQSIIRHIKSTHTNKSTNSEIRIYSGINIQDITLNLKEAFNLNSDNGVLIAEVESDSPGSHAGLMSGDVIVSIGERKVKNVEDVLDLATFLNPGDSTNLNYIRDKRKNTTKINFQKKKTN